MIEIKRSQHALQMPVERAQKPAEHLDLQATGRKMTRRQAALQGEIKPFVGNAAARDYRAMYRAAYEYHMQHSPPQADRAYWQTHIPGVDATPQLDHEYWDKAAQDVCEVSAHFENDPFIMDLLTSIYSELEREYEKARGRQ